MSTRTWTALLLSLLMVACGGGGSDAGSGGSSEPPPANGYALVLEPDALTVGQGREALLSVSLSRDAGFAEPVVVSLKDAPAGVASGTLELAAGVDRALLPIRLAGDLAAGTVLTLRVQATSGLLSREASSTLTVAAPKPLAQQAIASARRAGRIDYGTSLLYRAYALLGDARLPAEFVGDGSVEEDNLLFEEIRLRLADFSPERQAQLRAFLVRPTDPTSVWYRSSAASAGPQRATTLAFGSREGTAPAVVRKSAPPPETCASLPDGQWISKRSVQHPLRVWMQCGPRPELTDEVIHRLADAVLSVLNTVYLPMTGILGPPLGDLEGGGDNAIDFYIVHDSDSVRRRAKEFRPSGKGITFNEAPYVHEGASSFVLIPRSTLLMPEAHTTLVHELFHVLQNRHNARLYTPRDVNCDAPQVQCRSHWFVEASAAWAAAHFDRTAWSGVRAAFQGTYYRFASIFQPSDLALNATDDGATNHDYSAFIWPYFVEQETKNTAFMTHIWNGLAGVRPGANGDAFEAADDVIDAVYPFEANFRRFAVRNLNREFIPDGPLPQGERYVKLDPGQFGPADNKEPPYLPGELVAESPYSQPLELANLSARYVRLTVREGAGVLKVELDTGNLAPANLFVAQAIILTDKGWLAKPVTLESGKTEFCFDLGPSTETVRGSFKEIVLVLSNHGLRKGDVVKGDLKALATAAPCAPIWSGTIRQTIRSVTDVSTTTVTTSANVAFEFDPEADPVEGEVRFRLKSGTWTFDLRTDMTGRNPPCRAIGSGSGALPLTPYSPLIPSGTSAGLIITPGEVLYAGNGTSVVTVTLTENCNDANEDRTTIDDRYMLFWWNENVPGDISADGNTIRRSYTGENGVEYEIALDKTPRGR